MTRPLPFLIRSAPALFALAAAVPLAAQSAPGGFSLPQPTPTPTPAPAGPADERAGVVIPPRSVTPAPRITPAPVLTDDAISSPAPTSSPASPRPRQPQPTARPVVAPPPAASTASPTPTATPLATEEPGPGFPTLEQPIAPIPLPGPLASPAPLPPVDAPSDALGASAFDWRWLAAGAALLASLLGAVLLWRRRKPKVLRLAAAPQAQDVDAEPALPRIDLSLEIPGATRSVMTFTLRYRLTLANRTGRAVNDLSVAVQLACAQRGSSNAAPVAAAHSSQPIERIGPHQSRSISGEVQLPLTAVTPIIHGKTALFIPLFHVTIEGEGQQALAKSFVIGTPSGGEGRVQPIVLAGPPGALPLLAARAIDLPPTA